MVSYHLNCTESRLIWHLFFAELGRRSIYHATHRDAYSGGTVRVYHVMKDGWKLISEQDCLDLHHKYESEKKK
jgi:20S proteasome subunit beta 5